MDFVMQWLWYLLAFVAGSAVAWIIAAVRAKRVGNRREIAADASGSREVGVG
jgi:uncharacterized membrane protein ArfB